MNRFRTKKKGKEAAELAGHPTNDSDAPSISPLKSSKTFRLGRKNAQVPERKLELDLANALPSSDDFRTSLLMSGLSARFSMLREQDDPKSKIGKASDDSVLFPKRQSRLNDFGFQPSSLHDIAEVASIRTSIRPPFASDRVNSYHSVDSSGMDDGGSIMSRAKPGEGNNLFGGRQKIYKIPAGGSASGRNPTSNGEAKSMGGRALYDDDVSQSAFQKLRERERGQREWEREEQERVQQECDDAAQLSFPLRSNSPPLSGYNRNRETSSTTSSGPSLTRTSTAATSVTSQRSPSVNGYSSPSTPAIPNQSSSQGMDRPTTKGKRLYETGLDHHLYSQQHSAMNRIDSISRQQTLGVRTPSPSLGSPAGNIYEHAQASNSTSHYPTIRSSSPPPAAVTLGSPDFGVKSATLEAQKPMYVVPPLSPPVSDGDDQSSLPIQPNDRGKATALGTFSKPIQPYDENKYTQRQLQMQQGRETPPLRKHSPSRAFHSGQPRSTRTRAESNSTYSSGRSRSSSSSQSQFAPQNRFVAPQVMRMETPATDSHQMLSGTFLSSPNAGSKNSSVDGVFENGRPSGHSTPPQFGAGRFPAVHLPVERPPESQHPANRQRSPRLWVNYTDGVNGPSDTNDDNSPSISVSNGPESIEKQQLGQKDTAADSPTLGPASGLSGLVRQHLRTDSNASSVYGAPSPGLASRFAQIPPESTTDHAYSKGNPWEMTGWDQAYHDQPNGFNHVYSNATVNTGSPVIQFSSTLPKNTGEIDQERHDSSWKNELNLGHRRDGSSETQKERVDFAIELANRRKRVQANLKSFAESDSRSISPASGMDWEKDVNSSKSNTIGMPKPKSSRDSIITKSKNGQSKAMKMLGIGNSTINSSASPENRWKQEEEEMLRGVVKSPRGGPTTKAFRQARRDAQRDRERQIHMRYEKREATNSGDSDMSDSTSAIAQPRQPLLGKEREPGSFVELRAPSQESKSSVALTNRSGSRPPSRSTRDRSSSDASGRSKSRNGRYRDDLAKAMAEGYGSSAQGVFQDAPSPRVPSRSPATPGFAFPHSPSVPSPSIPYAGRSRSNSRSTPTGYLDGHQLQPIQTNHPMDIGQSPRPSPATPFSVNPTPVLTHPSPIPSGASTPTVQGFQSQGRIPANLKRVVNKSDISEPTLVSKTSRMITVDLPAGASLQNGMPNSAPPVPPIDPRRGQMRTQTVFGSLMRKGSELVPTSPMTIQGYSDEMSTFSADEADQKSKPRQKLRKSSSEGGNLNARARQALTMAPNPTVPSFPVVKSSHGGMF